MKNKTLSESEKQYRREILQEEEQLPESWKNASREERQREATRRWAGKKTGSLERKQKQEQEKKQFQEEVKEEEKQLLKSKNIWSVVSKEERKREALKRVCERRRPEIEVRWNWRRFGAFRFQAKSEEIERSPAGNFDKKIGGKWACFVGGVCQTKDPHLAEALEQQGYEQLLPARLEQQAGERIRQEEAEQKKKEEEEKKKQQEEKQLLKAVKKNPGKINELLEKQKTLLKAIRKNPGAYQELIDKAKAKKK